MSELAPATATGPLRATPWPVVVGRWLLQLAVIVGLYQLLLAWAGGNRYLLVVLTQAGIYVIMAVSLNLILGYTGQLSIGHAGFMAVGAYAAAILTKFFDVPFPVALAAGGLLAGAAGLLVGIPSLRLRGDYLAIATLGFGEIISVLLSLINEVPVGTRVIDVGGAQGLIAIPRHTTFAWTYGVAVLAVKLVWHFVHSTHGRACIAIREDEVAAEAMGIPSTRYKVMAFTIGALLAGVAGGLHAHQYLYLNPALAGFMNSVFILVIVVIGGMGSTTGAVLAAVFFTYVNQALPNWMQAAHLPSNIAPAVRMVLFSVLLILVMLVRPRGLLGGVELTWDQLGRWWRAAARAGRRHAVAKGGQA
ncbi:amino acid/amide ABC transporter membrane protein 2, HAAT family [Thermaerobacter marianensis DSM 12885]|uniref:Amino acid/amide ABC transporter membrane protein 2, HAAT family n=1 Tax=Thermaerobacter marianensis (strain ATCC 700841 / DSM 12885 / JCM 10246 / 7p75a) TaxID=644966 RepID=E6SLX9_THEM7|nr:branched-chain amino acid ABC transporter permease [Thermaerobacter marianensis]ADU52437.1 amino acid/amide ABC transporter membrane protein 2, HAAT family [Thermaerobacter marianensis DSM 12885]